ncbi:uncharacterized protein LOC109723523 isoform X1 [Ananas comosus]|uniref:Uncharacterized protein LOC109723523 isoform X1 n=1 Tax=Ananas comosus TaxID=4615 RepID=A0A6P5GFU7_ANACO|nr:uncharacterized protein LOC109723523 isoform X1 [Ananas comosus]
MDSKDDFSPDVLGENPGTQVEQGKAVNRQDHARPASSSPGVGYSGEVATFGLESVPISSQDSRSAVRDMRNKASFNDKSNPGAPTPSFADGGYSKSPYSTTGKVGVDIKASTPMKKAQPPSVRSTQLHRYSDEIPSLSSHGQCRFVHKNHQYGDEIPSLSRHRQGRNFPKNHRYGDEIPSLSRHGQRQFSPKNDHYGDEIPSLSSKRQGGHFARNHSCGDEIPSLFSHGQGRYSSKNLQYADEIPSLSKQVQVGYSSRNHHYGDEIPSLSSQGQGQYSSKNNHYGDEIPSLSKQGQVGYSSRNHHYGDEIPSLSSQGQGRYSSKNNHYGDEIPSLSKQGQVGYSSRNHHYGDKIPSLSSQGQGQYSSKNNHYGDEIPSLSKQGQVGYSSRNHHYGDEIPSLSSQGQGRYSPKYLQYGDEIPSLSKLGQVGYSSRNHHYGDEIPSLSSQGQGRYSSKYLQCGDKIPSLSKQGQVGYSARNNHYCDEIPSLSSQGRGGFSPKNHCYRDEIPSLSNQDVGYFPGNNLSESRPVDQIVNNNDHFNMNEMNNFSTELVRGPRADRSNNSLASSDEKYSMKQSIARDQYNKPDFETKYEQAKFFMIKSFSEDDVQKSIKYNVWASTTYGNKKLDMAFRDAQMVVKEKGTKCPIFLFFSVNTSGQFVGLAEMIGPVDFKKNMEFWQQDRWNGFFPLTWHIIKDIPNRHFHSIKLENNDNQVVTFSRDTQEIGLPQGLKMLEIFKDYPLATSILDDFDFYEDKQKSLHATSSHHVTYAHQVEFDEDVYEMEFNEDDSTMNYLEEGFGEMSFSSGHRKHSGPSVY